MTQSQLIQHFSAPGRKITVAKLGLQLKRENFSLRELVDLTFYPDNEIALKASRLMEYILFKFPENYYPHIEYVIARAKDTDTLVSKKSYAKILMHITSPDVPKDVRNKMREIDLEHVIGLCFEWMENSIIPVNTRASAMEALFNMRHQYPWIAEQLSKRVELILQTASPYLSTKCNFILGYLHPED